MSVHFLKCFPLLSLLSCSEDDDQEVYDDIAAGQGINDINILLMIINYCLYSAIYIEKIN